MNVRPNAREMWGIHALPRPCRSGYPRVPTLPPIMPLPSTGEMRSLAYNAHLALDARMGRATSIRAIGLATYRESLSAPTPEDVSPPDTDRA